jgi:hypothetical protein
METDTGRNPRGDTLELYVRSLTPAGDPGPENGVIDRVQALDWSGGGPDASVVVWGNEVALSTTATETSPGRHVLDRVAAFTAWAADSGCSLTPFFETRRRTSRLTGESFTALRLPAVLLAEYRDGELVAVTPRMENGETHTVAERLSTLESAIGELPQSNAFTEQDEREREAGSDDVSNSDGAGGSEARSVADATLADN